MKTVGFRGLILNFLKKDLLSSFGYRESENRTRSIKSGLRSKVVSGEKRSRFSTVLVIFHQIAAIRFLVSEYRDSFRYSRELRSSWNSFLRSRDVQWPYIVASIEDRRVIRLAIWSRHKLVDDFEMDALYDKHPSDIKAVLRKFNR